MPRIIAAVSAEDTAVKYQPPVTRNLEAWYFLNTNADKAARNYALGKPDGALVGGPTVAANYAAFTGNTKYLQTQVADAALQTIFALVKTPDTLADDAHSPIFYGTEASGSAGTSLAWRQASNQLWFSGAHLTSEEGPGQTGIPAFLNSTNSDLGNWNIFVGVNMSTTNRLINATRAVEHTATPSAYPRSPSTQRFRIGSDYTTSGSSGISHVALWAHYSDVLTDDEIAAVVANIRAYAAGRGITA